MKTFTAKLVFVSVLIILMTCGKAISCDGVFGKIVYKDKINSFYDKNNKVFVLTFFMQDLSGKIKQVVYVSDISVPEVESLKSSQHILVGGSSKGNVFHADSIQWKFRSL